MHLPRSEQSASFERQAAEALVQTTEALIAERERCSLAAEEAMRQRAQGNALYNAGLEALDQWEDRRRPKRSDDAEHRRPRTLGVFVERWYKEDPDSVEEWAQGVVQQEEHARQVEARVNANQAVLDAAAARDWTVNEVAGTIFARHPEARQMDERMGELLPTVLDRELHEAKHPHRDDPFVLAEAARRLAEAEETRRFQEQLLTAGFNGADYKPNLPPASIDVRGLETAAYMTPDVGDDMTRASVASKSAVQRFRRRNPRGRRFSCRSRTAQTRSPAATAYWCAVEVDTAEAALASRARTQLLGTKESDSIAQFTYDKMTGLPRPLLPTDTLLAEPTRGGQQATVTNHFADNTAGLFGARGTTCSTRRRGRAGTRQRSLPGTRLSGTPGTAASGRAAPAGSQITVGGPANVDYASLIENDPAYQSLKNLLSAQGISDASHLRGALQQALIAFGDVPNLPQDILDQTGLDTAGTKSLAQNNPFSLLKQLAQKYQDSQDLTKNQLAARGILNSGETGYQLGKLGQQQGQSQYDATNSLLGNIDTLESQYAAGQQAASQQLAQGALTARTRPRSTGSRQVVLAAGRRQRRMIPQRASTGMRTGTTTTVPGARSAPRHRRAGRRATRAGSAPALGPTVYDSTRILQPGQSALD